MALMLIKSILDSKNNAQVLDAHLVVNPDNGKDILTSFNEALNLLKDGTIDASANLPEEYNNLLNTTVADQ